ncbi:hypothetical protein MAP00_008050 [Monascus purpureus]|nr:hypothetical protein MAP00_008050 [Monascus purpureus]
MAAAPLDSSSTPPRLRSTESSTYACDDPMEDNELQETRKRPRLDSGSGACESMSIDQPPTGLTPDPVAVAPAAADPSPSTPSRSASRVAINMKSTVPAELAPEPSGAVPEEPIPVLPEQIVNTGAHSSTAISISSSTAQSPEIEVAEVEDMDQDPATSNWKSLEEALRDRAAPEVVQLQEPLSLTELFPKLSGTSGLRESLEEICSMLEKGSPHDGELFIAIKNWMDDCLANLNQLTYGELANERDFWEEFPCVIESLLRRVQDFLPDAGQGPWNSLEEFFVGFARLTLHLVHLDTMSLSHLVDKTDVPAPEQLSRCYLPSLGWILQIYPIPFFRTLERYHGAEVVNLIARINDQIAAPPIGALKYLSEYAACVLTLLPRWPQLASILVSILTIAQNMIESGNERKKYPADEMLIESPVFARTMKAIYTLFRAVDEEYQQHISKKSPWLTSDISESIIRSTSFTYLSLSQHDPNIALQLAKDLSIEFPERATPDEYPTIIHWAWKFNALKKSIMEGRMELRVYCMETMQSDLVSVWRQFIQTNPAGIEHPIVQYLLKFLRENKIVEYVVGIGSHPQLISRSGNIVGFLVVTSTYTDADTDTIWRTVTESEDPRAVSEVLGMLSRTIPMHQANSTALLYLCSKLLELPLNRFDSRMLEFCDQLLHQLREKYGERSRHEQLDSLHVDTIPLRLCVRLIRESTASGDLPVENKALLQRFAGSQLGSFISVGLSDMDRMEMYERCIQDIAEMNQFAAGSIQALNALLPPQDSQEIRKLATDFDLARLAITEISYALESNRTDFADPFSRNGFISRIQMLSRIIDKVPDTITPDLSDVLWKKIFMSNELVEQARSALWDMLCRTTSRSSKRNPFIDRCIQEYLPQLSPDDYSPELLSFAKHTMTYEIRFNPPPSAGENEVVWIPGMDRIWTFILTARPGSIETEATNFAIEVYLDHILINKAPRSAVEATHIAIVDRCVEQLKSAAANLKSSTGSSTANGGTAVAAPVSQEDIRTEELRFSRSLLFLRQLLQGLRARPQYSPPQGPPPDLPERPEKGDPVEISYQAFNGGSQSKVSTFRIGDLSTASELVDRLIQLTGFSKFSTIYGGQKIDLLENPGLPVREMKVHPGLLIVRKVPESVDISFSRRQSQTLVDSEVLKHFDDLYDLLNLDDHLAREIYDFLVVFPPQDRIRQLVKSEKTEQDIFPIQKPFSFLYSLNTLSVCLREEALEVTPNQSFVSHSINTLVASLIRPGTSESISQDPIKLLLACNSVECLLLALLVKPRLGDGSSVVLDPAPLIRQLLKIIETVRPLSVAPLSQIGTQKLICNSFAVLMEASVRDNKFWTVLKGLVQLDRLVFMLLLDESRQPIRKGIAENIAIICGGPKSLKKPNKLGTPGPTSPENPASIDILATIWDGFVKTFPQTPNYAQQSQEFFEVALSVFCSVADMSPHDLIFGDYLREWSSIMLSHQTEEFVGREPVDPLVLGFCRLLKLCLDLADSNNTSLDTFDLAESLFNNYLFPDLSMPSDSPMAPQVPVMNTQIRQELYAILILLCKYDENYSKMVSFLEDLIPQDYTYSPNWGFERQKMIRSPEGYAGLKNLSNTCYLNSLLTQLFMNVGFREFMLQLDVPDPGSTHKLLDETKKVFGYMQETWLKSVDPQGFVDTIRTYDNEPIDVTIQMDVDEFYNLLFDRWEAQILDPEDRKKFRSFYGGQLVQQIKSKECPHISERLEPFSAIQCDIKGKLCLEDSLQAYVEGEIMQGDNKYSCTSCGRHVDAVKRACLKDIPDNLIFHLKRFDFDMLTMLRSKINDEFQFPEHIDMSPYKVESLSEPSADVPQDIFQLVGVLVHSGTAESGHYYSYIRKRPTDGSKGSWVEFNDSDVTSFDPSNIADQCFGGFNDSHNGPPYGQVRFNKVWNAYMLFYQRVSSMETAKSIYEPIKGDVPVRVSLPVPLGNHIAMENEIFIRTYCLLDPYHIFFVRHLLSQSIDAQSGSRKASLLNKTVIFIALDTLEQLISRTREPFGLDNIVTEIMRAITSTPKGAYRVLQWVLERPTGVRNLILRCPYAAIRNSSLKIFASALTKLQMLSNDVDLQDIEREKWRMRYLNIFDDTVATLAGLWSILHTSNRSWDDYFDFLLLLANFGPHESGVLLNYGFLKRCLEIVWLDREDPKKLKRQYVAYYKLMEKGRRFSHKKLTDFLFVLLKHINLTIPPTPDGDERTMHDGQCSMTVSESYLIRPLGRNNELLLLKKLLQQYSSPVACKNILTLFLQFEPEAQLMEPICKTLEDGLRVAPAALCAPFLDATLVFCKQSPDEERIVGLIDFVAKGVESINNSGGKEHLSFFTNILTVHNEIIEKDDTWFSSQVINRVADWAPTLLIYADKTVRNMTFEVLRQILFADEGEETDDEWQLHITEVAKDLAQACVDKLRRTYLSISEQSVEARAVDIINMVISHCLENYFGDSEEDQEFIRQANAVGTAIEELIVDLPEELASDEWEDNSVMASESDIGLAESP